MGIVERREREKENLRLRIVEAARDLITERGLEGLSMRAIAERVEYSPATLYLYFKDKEDLLRAVVGEAFSLLNEYMREAVVELGPEATPSQVHRSTGRAYVRFALENTAYFRIMFELPGVPRLDCPEPGEGDVAIVQEQSFDYVVRLLQRASDLGELAIPDALEAATISWGTVHGLTSLYLSGRLGEMVQSAEVFQALIEASMDTLAAGWLPRVPGTPGSEPRTPSLLRQPRPCGEPGEDAFARLAEGHEQTHDANRPNGRAGS